LSNGIKDGILSNRREKTGEIERKREVEKLFAAW